MTNDYAVKRWWRVLPMLVLALMTSLWTRADDYSLTFRPDLMQNQVKVTQTGENEWMFVTMGGDPYVRIDDLTRDLADDETCFMFDYKLNIPINDQIEFFFCFPNSGPTGGREVNFGGLSTTDEWKSVCLDFSAKRQEFKWGKAGDYLRFDVGNSSSVTLIMRNPRIGKLPYDPLAVYEIGTTEEFLAFVNRVNDGQTRISANLTRDIDLSDYPNTIMNRLDGAINGNGHKLTVAFDRSESGAAIINRLYGTVQNLIVDGTIRTSNNFAAAITSHLEGGRISNCVSLVDIISTKSGDGTHAGLAAVCEQPSVVENCVFAGSIQSTNTNNSGGIIGWSSATSTINNCLMIATIDAPKDGCYTFSRNPGSVILNNCYYLNSYGEVNAGGIKVTEDMLKSGKVCYDMNGDQSSLLMYQTLGEDTYPLPYSTHARVYALGTLRCDGKPIGDVTYTNSASGFQIPDHQYQDGFCTVCDHMDSNYIMQVDGIYQIAQPGHLKWLAQKVNSGETKVSAALLCDLNMEGIDMDPIGCEKNRFQGTFEGNNHRISNLVINRPAQQGVGLFGIVTGNVTVQNLILDETCSITGSSYGGIIGCSKGSATVIMTNLGNEGTVNVANQNGGGIMGCSDGNGGKFTFNRCYVTGTVSGGREDAALCGWVGTGAVVNDCWTIATVVNHDSQPFFRGSGTATNCWSTVSQSGIKACTEDEAMSGALTYKMNNGMLSNPIWYQTLGEDKYPTWDTTRGIVYMVDDAYGDIHDEATFQTYRDMYLAAEMAFIDGIVATRELVEYYEEDLATLSESTNREEFFMLVEEIAGDKTALMESKAAYEVYEQKVEDVILYLQEHSDFSGIYRDKVESYVEDVVQPGEEFPNGSYLFVIDQCDLTTEDILAEATYLETLLNEAIANGMAAGTDMTQMIVNADFSNGFSGWQGKHATGYDVTQEGTMRGGECYNSTFDMYQTITDLKNGVYLFQVNGAFRPAGDRYSTNYAANIYAGDNMVYLQADIEDMISVDAAEDRVNSWIGEGASVRDLEVFADGESTSSELEQPIGYVMHGIQSVCYAALAGRYPNAILAHVTDGTLTVGLASPGTGLSADWTGFANLKLTYCGTLEEAGDALDAVLACDAARAKTLIDYVCYDGNDYAARPNYSQATRDALSAAVASIDMAQSVEDKYELIQRFSQLFRSVYEEKKAYTQLINVAESIALSYIDFDNVDNPNNEVVYKVYDALWAAYTDGIYSAEEALAKKAEVRLEYPAYLLVSRNLAGNNTEIEQTAPNTVHIWTTNSGDPGVSIGRLTEDIPEGHTILTFEYKSDGNHRGEFFFADPLAGGREYWYGTLTKTPLWTRYYVDLAEPMAQFGWGHTGDWLRWDFIDNGWADLWVRNMEFVDQERLDALMENSMAKHAGTEADPYPIYTLEDLYQMHGLVKQGEMTYFSLENDIDMSGIDWTPLNLQDNSYLNWISFEGNGHVLSNLTSGREQQYSGFFGVLCGACRNVGFANVNIESQIFGTGVIGGYVGHSSFTGTTYIENVWVSGKMNVDNSGYAGGIAGNIGGPTVMKNVYANVNLTSQAGLVGGLVGRVRGQLSIENAYAAGEAYDGSGNICGIVGGGQNASTPASTYTNIVVWNNTDQKFGTTVAADQLTGISYYTGDNFAELQKTVVGWGAPWSCNMGAGEYPTFVADPDAIQAIKAIQGEGKIYNINGMRVEKTAQPGIYIIDGKKYIVK